MKSRLMLLLGFVVVSHAAFAVQPYAGQQQREIKSLSSDQVDGLLQGKGMGMAKAAELNHYPGPKHVLDSSDKLNLSQGQLQKTRFFFDEMKKEAMALGEKIVIQERRLDHLFASQTIDEKSLADTLNEIAMLRGKLRYVHLKTHLKQKGIMSAQQIKHYDNVRGYGTGKHHQHHH